MLKTITAEMLDGLSAEAMRSRRLRRNRNLHVSLQDPVQRLCNAFEPGTYVRPHRHAQEERWELFVVLRGAATLLIFDDRGTVLQRMEIDAGGPTLGVEIPPRTWHAIASRAPGTVLFEVKPGPYSQSDDKEFAGWAPDEEHHVAAREFEDWYQDAGAGAIPPPLVSPGSKGVV
ncbi:MAG: WbuC family cupin fold metalloprotein [Gammaproteobacteria bacterium]|nr:WbuC family cupin fold metalloprotein [Gammaproteobacteria bacterium]